VKPTSIPPARPVPLVEAAPAKINLTLRLLGRRPDGYHDLESLVAFSAFGDRLTLRPGPNLALRVGGATAGQAGDLADNLVLRAARALGERVSGLSFGQFSLTKRLPAGAGLGGGSSDAAAALRLLARANGVAADDPRLFEAARATGADIPVCLDGKPRIMRGIGEKLSAPLALPPLHAVIVGPGFPLATRDVFSAVGLKPGDRRHDPTDALQVPTQRDALFAMLAAHGNDLEAAAIRLAPAVADLIAALRALPGCRLARMSGSGSACFALFTTARAAAAAARGLSADHPEWWIQASALGE
jgi:4-diphosphocytidyl-2-C-methyl-D-erythritol kinase